ncbi:hypothetical protein, partial [Salmonella enterica]|uniref:hypothetical protein n=1 Tax=Salmonella enterica TaxID=28901 RepID=UPI003298F30C
HQLDHNTLPLEQHHIRHNLAARKQAVRCTHRRGNHLAEPSRCKDHAPAVVADRSTAAEQGSHGSQMAGLRKEVRSTR